MQQTIYNKFKEKFSGEPALFSAPGRINVIGEHTDYNDGFVLPAAINKRIYFALRKNGTKKCNIHAHDLNEDYSFSVNQKEPVEKTWVNYLLGVVREALQIKEFKFSGIDCVFGGDLPTGAGLSSSAALETGFAHGLNETFDIGLSLDEIMWLSQKAEHNFVGLQCGIMDQFSAVHGKKDHVMQLDTRSMESHYYPAQFGAYRLVLCDSKVKHSLASSAYNKRREECNQAVSVVQKAYPQVNSLRDMSDAMLEIHRKNMSDEVFKRALYVLQENERVHQTAELMQQGNIDEIGEKLYQSHKGLSEMYEVSCDETDFLVDITKDMDTVKGARMMGGGFGGCTINLVHKDAIQEFEEIVKSAYSERFNIEPAFYDVKTDNGIQTH